MNIVLLSLAALSIDQLLWVLANPQPLTFSRTTERINIYDQPPLPKSVMLEFGAKTVTSFEDFGSTVDQAYAGAEEELTAAWSVGDVRLLRALFYMNLVSSLLPYGNEINQPGCVVDSKVSRPLRPTDLSIRDYLDAKNGCCSDFVLLLQYLLKRAHYESKVVVIPGHVMIEVSIENEPWVFDPSGNLAINRRWSEPTLKNKKPTAMIFAHSGLDAGQPSHYRPIVAFIRNATLSHAALERPPFTEYAEFVPGYGGVDFDRLSTGNVPSNERPK